MAGPSGKQTLRRKSTASSATPSPQGEEQGDREDDPGNVTDEEEETDNGTRDYDGDPIDPFAEEGDSLEGTPQAGRGGIVRRRAGAVKCSRNCACESMTVKEIRDNLKGQGNHQLVILCGKGTYMCNVTFYN